MKKEYNEINKLTKYTHITLQESIHGCAFLPIGTHQREAGENQTGTTSVTSQTVVGGCLHYYNRQQSNLPQKPLTLLTLILANKLITHYPAEIIALTLKH